MDARTPIPSSSRPCQSWSEQREADDREGQRGPDPPPHRLVEDVPRVERDEHRRDVLDQQRDADLQSLDRHEVEPGDECQAGDAEDGEKRQLAEAHAKGRAPPDEQDGEQEQKRSGGAHLGQPLRGHAARLEDHLRDGAVQRPERRRREHHRVPQRGPAVHAASLSGWRLYTATAGTWRSLVARPLWEREAAGSNPAVPTSPFRSAPRR